jgi:methionyl-tRNA formyltransferase
MGVIYRAPVLGAFRLGVLNAHIGMLPEYKGRSVMEWSVLAGAPTGVTVFFMDSGIDTGSEIVIRKVIDVTRTDGAAAAKTSLFKRDGEMYRAALEALRLPRPRVRQTNEGGRRYYVMSGLFSAVVDAVLHAGAWAATWETHTCISTAETA